VDDDVGVEEGRGELEASLGDLADAGERGGGAVGGDFLKEFGRDVEVRGGRKF